VKKYNICTVIEYGAVILFLISKFSSSVGRAMAKADSRHACLLRLCWICCGQNSSGTSFCPSTSVLPCLYYFCVCVCVFCAANSSRSRTPISLRFGMCAYVDIEIFVPRGSDFTYFTVRSVILPPILCFQRIYKFGIPAHAVCFAMGTGSLSRG
jgi:hypothetical protein